MRGEDIIKALTAAGWRKVAQKGSHVQFRHPTALGRVTVPHPKRDLPVGNSARHREAIRASSEVNMPQYIALIHKDAESDFGVSFPDLPGCVSAGADLDEAQAMAAEALAFHLEGMAADGEPIPSPSPLSKIMADVENRDGVAILVSAPLAPVRAVRVNITLPEDVLREIDAYAESNGYTRSGFLANAAR